jgi:hypothetical protein
MPWWAAAGSRAYSFSAPSTVVRTRQAAEAGPAPPAASAESDQPPGTRTTTQVPPPEPSAVNVTIVPAGRMTWSSARGRACAAVSRTGQVNKAASRPRPVAERI